MPLTIDDFSEGLIDRTLDSKIPVNSAQACSNFIGWQVGALDKRNGQVHLNATALPGPIQGLYACYIGGVRQILAAANGSVYVWTGSAWSSIYSGLSTTAQINFCTLINQVVFSDGVNTPASYTGTGSATALTGAPVGGQFPTFFADCLFVVGAPSSSTTSSELLWSAPFYPANFTDLQYYWQVWQGDGDVITALVPFLNDLVVFKRYSIHVLKGASIEDYSMVDYMQGIGCVGAQAACVFNELIWFVADDGLYYFDGVDTGSISYDRIPNWFRNNVNAAAITKAACGVWRNWIWFALPTGSSTTNNAVVLYIPPTTGATGGKFFILNGINAQQFLRYNTGSGLEFFAGDPNGYVNQLDTGSSDFGNAISAFWIPQTVDKNIGTYKMLGKASIADTPGWTTRADLFVATEDSGSYTQATVDTELTDSLHEVFRVYGTYRFHQLQAKISHTYLGPYEVRNLVLDIATKGGTPQTKAKGA
jgi:hypothetical protein